MACELAPTAHNLAAVYPGRLAGPVHVCRMIASRTAQVHGSKLEFTLSPANRSGFEQTGNNFLESSGICGILSLIGRSRGAGGLSMEEETASPSQRDEARAAAKRRRTKGFDRREAIFDLFVSGFSHQQIATALKTSTPHRPARHRHRRRRAAARRARALRPGAGRATVEGALACRRPARAGRHPRLHALFENRGRARPLSRTRAAKASQPRFTQ